jgi:flagellar hook-associated protein 2
MADTSVASLSSFSSFQPAITFTGLGSDLDTQSIINKLVEVERTGIKRLESWKEEWTAKIQALSSLTDKLAAFRTAAGSMARLTQFRTKTATSGNTGVFTAAATAAAASGTHQITVNQLARSEVEAHAGLPASTAVVNSSGATQVFAFTYGASTVSIAVANGATLADLAAAINASGANPGVTASVLDLGTGVNRYCLMLQGNDTGSGYGIAIDDALTTLDGTAGTQNFESSTFTQTQAAANAQLRVDGYPMSGWIERSTNLVSDVVSGVSLSLVSTSASPVLLTIGDDTGAMQEEIGTLVEAYNEAIAHIRDLTRFGGDEGESGILLGNYGVQIIKSELNAIAAGNAPGFKDGCDSLLNLAQIGITTDVDETSETFGQLLIDGAQLAAALNGNPEGVARLMADYFTGVSDDATGNIAYFSSLPGITQPGEYEVTAQVVGGVLVSGAINGHAATVSGDTLTGAAGFPEYGLAVRVNLADGAHTGTVRLKLGKNGQFADRLEELLSASSGPVNILIDNYNDIIDGIDAKIDFEERRVEAYRQRLIWQFTQLETVLGQLNDQSQYLAGQIQKLGFTTSGG